MTAEVTDPKVQRLRFAADKHRPGYHFLAPANWMNDPNGVIQWQGRYHLFYQYNPQGAFWGTIHWGHAASDDLVHWQDLPVALAPTPDSPDEDGCWSGCAVDDYGTPTLVYTGARGDAQLICLATGTDDLRDWAKSAGNPVIAAHPPGLILTGFRDPYVWREAGQWHMIIGAGIKGQGGTVLLYQSKDLRTWDYLHPICDGDSADRSTLWTGTMWECPQLFPLGDKYILLISVCSDGPHYSAYMIGDYKDQQFKPDSLHYLDSGDHHFYAPQTLLDTHNRRLMWGWIQEARGRTEQINAGWSGVMSLPRALSLSRDNTLQIASSPELQSLRDAVAEWRSIELNASEPSLFQNIQGNQLEISAEISVGNASQVGIVVCCSPDYQENTRIYFDATTQHVAIDRRSSTVSDNPEIERDLKESAFQLNPAELLKFHIFVDCSVLEVYVNERLCLTSRVYPEREDSVYVGVFSSGDAIVNTLKIWKLSSI